MKHKCNVCGKEMQKVNDIELYGFKIKGWRCKCGNEHSNPEDVDNIVKLFKLSRKGAEASVFESGNSIAVRLPKAIVNLFRLKPKSKLIISTKENEIVLKVPGN